MEQVFIHKQVRLKRVKRNIRWFDLGLTLLSPICVIIVWQLCVKFDLVDLPTPLETLRALFRLSVQGDPLYNMNLWQMTGASLWIVTKGCLISFALAIPLGILIGASRQLELFATPILEIFRPIPPLAWIPLAYLIFNGLPNPTQYVQIFVVFVGAFFPALINTLHGIKSIDNEYLMAARICGSSPRQILWRVLLPASLPAVLTGVRIGVGIGWMCVVAAEFVGGRMGIGYYIWSSYSTGGRAPEITAGIIAIGAVGYLLNQSIIWLERRLLPWR